MGIWTHFQDGGKITSRDIDRRFHILGSGAARHNDPDRRTIQSPPNRRRALLLRRSQSCPGHMSSDPEQEYFSNSVSDIVADLSEVAQPDGDRAQSRASPVWRRSVNVRPSPRSWRAFRARRLRLHRAPPADYRAALEHHDRAPWADRYNRADLTKIFAICPGRGA